MKMKLVYLLTTALALNLGLSLHAEDPANPPKRPQRPEGGTPGRGAGGGMGEFVKQLGLDPEEIKNLPPEERRAKIMEAAKNKKAELEKKKAAGTLTDEEKKTLERMQNFRGGQRPQ